MKLAQKNIRIFREGKLQSRMPVVFPKTTKKLAKEKLQKNGDGHRSANTASSSPGKPFDQKPKNGLTIRRTAKTGDRLIQ